MNLFTKNERGSIALITAFMMIVLIGFAGVTADLGLCAMKRARLLEVGHMIRDARLKEFLLIDNANNPEQCYQQIARRYALANGYKADQVDVQYWFNEDEQSLTHRQYYIDITLTDTYNYCFLSLFGLMQQDISVTVRGSRYFDDVNGVWTPSE